MNQILPVALIATPIAVLSILVLLTPGKRTTQTLLFALLAATVLFALGGCGGGDPLPEDEEFCPAPTAAAAGHVSTPATPCGAARI